MTLINRSESLHIVAPAECCMQQTHVQFTCVQKSSHVWRYGAFGAIIVPVLLRLKECGLTSTTKPDLKAIT